MVARLAWLKLRLLWNGLRQDWQRRIGFPATLALMGLVGWFLAGRYLANLEEVSRPAALQLSLWAALGFYLLWVSLPVVIFPLDENLDPAQFALSPIPPRQLVVGLGVAALIAPSTVIPVVVLGSNVVAFAHVLPAALLSAVLLGAVLIVSGQLFTTAISAVLRTRRGRDLAILIITGIGLGGFTAQQIVRDAVGRLGLEKAVLSSPIEGLALVLPPVAAQRVATEAAAGRALGVAVWAVVAGAWVVALAYAWHRLLGWMLTTPEDNRPPSRRTSGRGLAGRRGWGTRTVLARKELRFYVRDPRQRLVWTGAVIFIGLAAATIVFGGGSLLGFRTREWLPLLAPGLVMFVGLPIALNLFGWERNAASFLFVLPARPRQLIVGKNLAAAAALALETTALALLLAWLSGGWRSLPYVPAFTIAAIGCQLAVGNLVSVLTPLRLPREGTDVFAQATEQGCLAIAAQLTSFFVIGLLLILPAAVTVLASAFGAPIPFLFVAAFCVGWGLLFYGLSLWLSGWILRRRVPEVVGWVQVV